MTLAKQKIYYNVNCNKIKKYRVVIRTCNKVYAEKCLYKPEINYS